MFQRRIISFLCLTVAVFLIFKGAEGWLNQQMSKSLNLSADTLVEILPGSNLSRFTDKLVQQKIIDKTQLLRLYARLNKQENIIAGEYFLQQGDTYQQLLKKITLGEVVEYQISFPEGITYSQWLEILASSDKLLQSDNIDLASIGIKVDHPEGWFFPDTYYFHRGEKDIDILLRAYRRAVNILDQQWQQRAAGLPYKTPYEALIMASIVEKETGVARERQAIAGVFVRRLNKSMRLQTDPTVIYGLGDTYQGNIRKKHLKQWSAYNTYMIKGLPPTPIAMPGRAAIYAALHPAQGNSLYFVAKGDGSHQFSATLRQHLSAVKQYQLQRTSDYRSTPGQ